MGSKVELNKGDQIIGLLDVSMSMKTIEPTLGGKSRLAAMLEAGKTIVKEACKWDEDGVHLFTFGHQVTDLGEVTADKVDGIFANLKANEASTDTAGAIKAAWDAHVKKGSSENTVVFVFTDGEPADRSALTRVLKDIAKKQEANNEVFSVSFLLVGEVDAGLNDYLTKLDDEPMEDKNGAEIDFIDKKNLHEVDFMAAFAGALGD